MPKRKSAKRQRRSHVANEAEDVVNLTVKSQVEFNDMNADCFRLIFNELPLYKVVKLRAVCTKWNEIIANDYCARKTSLQLIIINSPVSQQNKYLDSLKESKPLNGGPTKISNELKIFKIHAKHSRAELYAFLSRLFPNVQNLFILKKSFKIEDTKFISIWANQLISLTLALDQVLVCFSTIFIETLNQATALRKLNIFGWLFDGETSIWPPLAPTLARLECLGLNFWISPSNHLVALPLLGPNCHQLAMNCGSDDFTGKFLSTFKPNQPDLVNSLTHLTLTEFRDVPLLKLVAKYFINLKCLTVHCYATKYFMMGRGIVVKRLSALIPVELINAKNLEELTLLNIDLNLDFGRKEAPKNITCVKNLTLSAWESNSDFLTLKSLPEDWCERMAKIFPNLEQLSLKYESESTMHLKELPNYSANVINNRLFFKHLKSLTIGDCKFIS